MTMQDKMHDTKETAAIREAIDILERKKFFGITRSERVRLDYAAQRLRSFLPKQVATENKFAYCPQCSSIQPFESNETFSIYCTNCGQFIYNDGGK